MNTIDHHDHIKKGMYDLVELSVLHPSSGNTHSIDIYWVQIVTSLHGLKLKLKLKWLDMGNHCQTKFLNKILKVKFSTKKWLDIIESTITKLEYQQIISERSNTTKLI